MGNKIIEEIIRFSFTEKNKHEFESLIKYSQTNDFPIYSLLVLLTLDKKTRGKDVSVEGWIVGDIDKKLERLREERKSIDVEKKKLKDVRTNPKKQNPRSTYVLLFLFLIGGFLLIFIASRMRPTQKKGNELNTFQSLVIHEKNGLYGYKMGKQVVIPAIYQKVSEFQGNFARVSTPDSTFLIDTENNWIKNISYTNSSLNRKNKKSTPLTFSKKSNPSNNEKVLKYKKTKEVQSNLKEWNGYYKYVTYFDNYGINPSLYSEPTPNSRKVYECPSNAKVFVIDDTMSEFYKVNVNGRIGYISNVWLKKKKNSLSSNSKSKSKSNTKMTTNLKYWTTFKNVDFKPSLYSEPSVNSQVIYKCPIDSKIELVNKYDSEFYMVRIDGHVGYISKVWLK